MYMYRVHENLKSLSNSRKVWVNVKALNGAVCRVSVTGVWCECRGAVASCECVTKYSNVWSSKTVSQSTCKVPSVGK